MRAIGFQQPGSINRHEALVDIELPTPTPTGRDLLVEIKAISVNPVEVIATASRAETVAWVEEMGAHHIIDHSLPLAEQVAKLGLGAPAFVFSTTQTDRHLDEIAALIAPQGRFGLIDDPAVLDINRFKRKSVSVHWELMFTRWRSLSE